MNLTCKLFGPFRHTFVFDTIEGKDWHKEVKTQKAAEDIKKEFYDKRAALKLKADPKVVLGDLHGKGYKTLAELSALPDYSVHVPAMPTGLTKKSPEEINKNFDVNEGQRNTIFDILKEYFRDAARVGDDKKAAQEAYLSLYFLTHNGIDVDDLRENEKVSIVKGRLTITSPNGKTNRVNNALLRLEPIDYKRIKLSSSPKPTEKTADKPAEKPVAKPADKPVDKPPEKPVEKAGTEVIEGDEEVVEGEPTVIADYSTAKPEDKPTEKPADKPAPAAETPRSKVEATLLKWNEKYSPKVEKIILAQGTDYNYSQFSATIEYVQKILTAAQEKGLKTESSKFVIAPTKEWLNPSSPYVFNGETFLVVNPNVVPTRKAVDELLNTPH